MWASIRSRAIQESGHLHLWGNLVSLPSVHTSLCSLRLDGEAATFHGPRSFNLGRSREVRDSARSHAVPLRDPSVPRAVLAEPELGFSNGLELISISVIPDTALLGSCLQVTSRKCRSSYVDRDIVLVQCGVACALCEVFYCLQ